MTDRRRPARPTPSRPQNGEPRPWFVPLLATVALLLVILAVFAGIMWIRYHAG